MLADHEALDSGRVHAELGGDPARSLQSPDVTARVDESGSA